MRIDSIPSKSASYAKRKKKTKTKKEKRSLLEKIVSFFYDLRHSRFFLKLQNFCCLQFKIFGVDHLAATATFLQENEIILKVGLWPRLNCEGMENF